MYLYSKNELPKNIMNLFTVNRDIHSHHTRHRNDPYVVRHKTAYGMNCFLHQCPKIWHDLPADLKETKNNHTFIKKVKSSLIAKY